jgi:rhamnopyranosyl-N-acetylglucosaminyl-diphospho-decaprenol beta-1,3/1,4-galactofuranosyltransferase
MKSVVAVIVTYNRVNLLKEAVCAVKSQTYPIQDIHIIDNGSTDGTADWLNEQSGLSFTRIAVNTGASGGFNHGLKTAAAYNSDWVWVMDDDTICKETTLAELVKSTSLIDEPIGFIGSKCVWTDGAPHYMNVPAIKPSFNKHIPFNRYDGLKLILTETTSWVSLLINTKAIIEVGLPYKEFFHWSDDCEYTRRITKAGYLGFYSMDSVVTHKTPSNYCPDFYRDIEANLWKHSYGFRNEFYLQKKYNGFTYYIFWLILKVTYTSMKLLFIRKDHHLTFMRTLFTSAWKSLFFNPTIETF